MISCVLDWRRCVACVRHANNCPVSCFGMAITASDLPGRRRIGAGCPASSSTNLSIIVLEDAVAAVEAATARRNRLEAQIEATLPEWSLAAVVQALQALRGIRLVAAATLVAEIGDITRFTNPRQLMAYLGLVPSEHSSGSTRRQGGITKAGNGAARGMLIEAAWSYRFPARISRELPPRQEHLAKPIRDIARKAQERLCRRYRKMTRDGKLPTVITTAIARELAGFVWAIAKQVHAISA